MDDLANIVLMTIGLIFAIFGVIHVGDDYRHFKEVQEQCSRYGFIQNKTVRITCVVEKTNG